MDFATDVPRAHERIRRWVLRTPLEHSPRLSDAGNCRVHLKLENQQRTGSFKLRGAMNKLLALEPEVRERGVVAASTGNHGAAVAWGAAALGCPAVIYAPEDARPSKLDAIRAHGAEVVLEGADCVLSEAAARAHASERGAAYVSPYNDPLVVAGQGTVGLELHEDLERLDAVIVAVGGGGLIAGVGGWLKSARADVEVVACSPRNSAVMHASIAAGRMLDLPSEPTLSDGTAGGVEADTVTFEPCREVIDEFLLVDEDAIAEGVREIVARHHLLVEGAAGMAVGAFLSQGERWRGKDVAIVLCGANIDASTLKELL